MSLPFSNLNSKLEQAGAAYITSKAIASNPNIYTGEGNADKVPPAVIFYADETPSEEYPPQTGNYWKTIQVIVMSVSEIDVDGVDPKSSHDLLVGTVDYWMSQSDLAAQLNAQGIADFGAMFQEWHGFAPEVQDSVWISTAHLRILCCASSIGA